MATSLPTTNGAHDTKTNGDSGASSFAVKAGLARMLKGGVIMDVVNAEQVCFVHIPGGHPTREKHPRSITIGFSTSSSLMFCSMHHCPR